MSSYHNGIGGAESSTAPAEAAVFLGTRNPAWQSSLEEVVRSAQPVLMAHAMAKHRLNQDEADDLLQSFWCQRVVAGNALQHYEPSRANLHTFLQCALDRFLVSEWRRSRAQKRCPAELLVPLDAVPDSQLPRCEPNSEAESDVRWGRVLVINALQNMRSELTRRGRADIWAVFENRLLLPTLNDEPPMPYDQLVKQFGFASPTIAFNTLLSAKRIFRRHLRAVIAEFNTTDCEIDEEIHRLKSVFERASGQVVGAGTGRGRTTRTAEVDPGNQGSGSSSRSTPG